ncbi:MAG: hypothetical protein ABI165_07450 [Bryobacteraceae bacterium]
MAAVSPDRLADVHARVRGAFRVLLLYDVADEIRLEALRAERKLPRAEPRPAGAIPEGLQFERPPVLEPLDPFEVETGETLRGRIHYYDYGVVSVELELRFDLTWVDLVARASRWLAAPEIGGKVVEGLHARLDRAAKAFVNPYANWLTEDYYIIHLFPMEDADFRPITAVELLASRSAEIAQLVRGEPAPLSESECQEIFQSRISYYPSDLLVAGWTAAVLYDAPERAAPTIQLLEYANTQLLEFRHYDELLSEVLKTVYRSLGKGRRFWVRWRLAAEAERLNAIRLDVMELMERTDNAIKFLSDMFYARLYRVAASRVGVPDYRNLVERKLRAAGELYQFMVDQFQHTRAFLLEATVVVILIVELVALFRGKGV